MFTGVTRSKIWKHFNQWIIRSTWILSLVICWLLATSSPSRYTDLERNFKQKITAEEKATGISPDEPTDLEKALEEIVQKFKDIELLDNSKKVSAEKERQAAADMRQQFIETFKETEKRKSDEVGGDNVRWRRISGNE